MLDNLYKNQPNKKVRNEILRWAIQVLMTLGAVFYVLFMMVMLLFFSGLFQLGEESQSKGLFLIILLYIKFSLFIHYKLDKNKSHLNSWWQSIRLYIFNIYIIIGLAFNNSSIKIKGIFDLFVFFSFLFGFVIYTWLLSEWLCRLIKNDRNLSFKRPWWLSSRIYIFLISFYINSVNILMHSVESKILSDYLYFIQITLVVFLWLRIISEWHCRRLNQLEKLSQ
jgi:hypothetical protein